MLGFNDSFQVQIHISEDEFIDKLTSCVDMGYDSLTDLESNRMLPYVGNIAFNEFSLESTKKLFKKWPGVIKGTFHAKGNKVVVNGKVEGYLLLISFNVIYTLVCLAMLVNFIFFNPSNDGGEVAFGIFSSIGLLSYATTVNKLSNLKNEFVDKIESFKN